MAELRPERIETMVIGGGQAGLSVGYHLRRHGIPFLIVDGGDRIGQAWYERWDSLRLFTPARYCGLDGMPFPAPGSSYPTKDEMGDYLQQYAERFDLPVRLGTEVDRVCRKGGRFMVASGDMVIEADNVVVAMGAEQKGKVPDFATDLDRGIFQIHSADYRHPGQLQDGDVLVVGAANSGVEIALDVSADRRVMLSGRHPGHIPFDIESFLGRHLLVPFVLRGLFHRIFSVRNPIGRRFRAKMGQKGRPLVRTKPRDVARAGIEEVPRVAGVERGLPLLEDGRAVDVSNVIWATGYDPGFTWLDVDILDGEEPRHRYGIVEEVPGLYFVGLDFLFAPSSGQIHGVGRDAARVADAIAARRGNLVGAAVGAAAS